MSIVRSIIATPGWDAMQEYPQNSVRLPKRFISTPFILYPFLSKTNKMTPGLEPAPLHPKTSVATITPPHLPPSNGKERLIDQFRYVKMQPKTVNLSTRLWRITTEFVLFIPQSLVLRSILC